MKIVELEEIRRVLPSIDLVEEIEAGFIAYSRGQSVVPPVGELVMKDPPGDVHIKYGYLTGDDYYVIKIASGFPGNPSQGLKSGNGMMLLFSQQTGVPVALLKDEAWLTDVRTAVAGTITAKYLAPSKVERIGIVGTGLQARLQLEYLEPVTDCRNVLVWGRDNGKLEQCAADMRERGFDVATTTAAGEIAGTCNLIVTTTMATEPILTGELRPGTHVTAMGSDTPEKQELAAELLGAADLVVVDSVPQSLVRGEVHHALNAGAIEESNLVELGSIIAGDKPGRSDDSQVTIADLTGVAVQDIKISKAVYEALT